MLKTPTFVKKLIFYQFVKLQFWIVHLTWIIEVFVLHQDAMTFHLNFFHSCEATMDCSSFYMILLLEAGLRARIFIYWARYVNEYMILIYMFLIGDYLSH